MPATLERPTPLIDLDLGLSDEDYIRLQSEAHHAHENVCDMVREKTLDHISEQLSPEEREAIAKQREKAEREHARLQALEESARSRADVYRQARNQRDALLARFKQVREQRQSLVEFIPSQQAFIDLQSFGGGGGKPSELLNLIQAVNYLSGAERGIVLADEWFSRHLPELEKLEAEVSSFEKLK